MLFCICLLPTKGYIRYMGLCYVLFCYQNTQIFSLGKTKIQIQRFVSLPWTITVTPIYRLNNSISN